MNIESLQAWLNNHIEIGTLETENTALVDIGAYRGDFTQQMFENSTISKAILFEPNINNYVTLQTIFSNRTNVDIIHCAMGDKEEIIPFHCDSDLATGSVLSYKHSLDDLTNIKQQKVQLSTIDNYFKKNQLTQKISVIKTDTQGFDLQVLKGAVEILKHHQPWLVVELIFVPLYENQSNPHVISTWLETQGYVLAGLFNIHYSAEGWLAFADGVFVPSLMVNSFKAPFYQEQPISQLLSENAMLRTVCEERLQLINRLHAEAALLRDQLLKN